MQNHISSISALFPFSLRNRTGLLHEVSSPARFNDIQGLTNIAVLASFSSISRSHQSCGAPSHFKDSAGAVSWTGIASPVSSCRFLRTCGRTWNTGGMCPIRETSLSVGILFAQRPQTTHKEHRTPVFLEVRTMREDSIPQRQPGCTCVCRICGILRRYVNVTSPCEEIGESCFRPQGRAVSVVIRGVSHSNYL